MTQSTSLFTAGSAVPSMTFPTVGGGEVSVGGAKDRWTLFVVYRGKHCGRCKPYLTKLQGMKAAWEEADLPSRLRFERRPNAQPRPLYQLASDAG